MVTIDFFLLLYCDGLTHGNNEIVRWRACGRLRGRGIARNEIEEETFRTRCADKRNGGREYDVTVQGRGIQWRIFNFIWRWVTG